MTPSNQSVAGPKSSVVAVKVLVKRDIVSPICIFLKLLASSVDRTTPIRVVQENAGEPSRNFLCHFEQRQMVARASCAFHLKAFTIELIKIEQSANQYSIYGHPHWSAPVGVASKHSAVALCRQILNFVFFVSDMEDKRVIDLLPANRAKCIESRQIKDEDFRGTQALPSNAVT